MKTSAHVAGPASGGSARPGRIPAAGGGSSDRQAMPEKPNCKAVEEPMQHRGILQPNQVRRAPGSTFLLLFALLVFLAFGARATVVTGLVYDVSINLPNTKLTFTPTNLVTVTGGGLQIGGPITINTTNGGYRLSLDPGDYLMTAPLIAWRKPVLFSVYDTNAVLNITNFLNNPLFYTYTSPSLSGGINAGVTNQWRIDATNIVNAIGGGGPTNGVTAAQSSAIALAVVTTNLPAGVLTNGQSNATLGGAFSGSGLHLTDLTGTNLMVAIKSGQNVVLSGLGTFNVFLNGGSGPSVNNTGANGLYVSNNAVSLAGPNGYGIVLDGANGASWLTNSTYSNYSVATAVAFFENSDGLSFSTLIGPLDGGSGGGTTIAGSACNWQDISVPAISSDSGTPKLSSSIQLTVPDSSLGSNLLYLAYNGFTNRPARDLTQSLPFPYVMINSFASGATYTLDCSEGWALGVAQYLNTNGYTRYLKFIIQVDDGWTYNPTPRDPSGHLQPDPSKFPHGIAWLAQKLATNNCLLMMYLPLGPTCMGYPSTDPAHLYWDVKDLMTNGVFGIKQDYCNGAGAYVVNGTFKSAEDLISFEIRTANQAASDFNLANHGSIATSAGVYITNQPFCLETILFDAVNLRWSCPSDVRQFVNIAALPGEPNFGGGLSTSIKTLRQEVLANSWISQPGTINEGWALFNNNAITKNELGVWAQTPCIPALGSQTNSPGAMAVLTNYPGWIAAMTDPAMLPSKLVYTNNGVEVYNRPMGSLHGTDRLVWVSNLSGSSTNGMVIGLGSVGLDSNLVYQVADIWNGTNTLVTGYFATTIGSGDFTQFRVSALPGNNASAITTGTLSNPTIQGGTILGSTINGPGTITNAQVAFSPYIRSQPAASLLGVTSDGNFTETSLTPALLTVSGTPSSSAFLRGDGVWATDFYAPNLLRRGDHSTNAAGPSPDASRVRCFWATNQSFTIGGISNLSTNAWMGTCVYSNSGASTITVTAPSGAGPIGAVTTNALYIPAGKMAYWSWDVVSGKFSNYCNAVSQ